jgi:hypothetical protein
LHAYINEIRVYSVRDPHLCVWVDQLRLRCADDGHLPAMLGLESFALGKESGFEF